LFRLGLSTPEILQMRGCNPRFAETQKKRREGGGDYHGIGNIYISIGIGYNVYRCAETGKA
jgi:hypothetical protein